MNMMEMGPKVGLKIGKREEGTELIILQPSPSKKCFIPLARKTQITNLISLALLFIMEVI